MNNTFNCFCEDIVDESSTDFIITQVFGWLTGILALVKIFFFTITLLIKKYAKNISWAFVIVGLVAAICAIIFGVRIDEISVYVRGTLMLILSIIIFIGKIVFDIEYDKRQKEKQIELLKINDNTKDIINELENFINTDIVDNKQITYSKNDMDFVISKNKIKINLIELNYNHETVKSIIDFIKQDSIIVEIDND